MEDNRVKTLLSKILWLSSFKRLDVTRGQIGIAYRFKNSGGWGILAAKPYLVEFNGKMVDVMGSRLGGRWLPRD